MQNDMSDNRSHPISSQEAALGVLLIHNSLTHCFLPLCSEVLNKLWCFCHQCKCIHKLGEGSYQPACFLSILSLPGTPSEARNHLRKSIQKTDIEIKPWYKAFDVGVVAAFILYGTDLWNKNLDQVRQSLTDICDIQHLVYHREIFNQIDYDNHLAKLKTGIPAFQS